MSGCPTNYRPSILLKAHPKQREIILHRIFRIEGPQVFGEFQHGFPIGLRALQQAEAAGYAFHVHVQWHE